MSARIIVHEQTKRVLGQIKYHDGMVKHGIRKALYAHGKDVVKEIQHLIRNTPKTGRIYIIRGRRHQASAPHEAPASLTGRLASSAKYDVHSFWKMEVGETARSAKGAPYPKFLEGGTRGRIAPRKGLLKAVNNTARNLQVGLNESVKAELGF